MLLSTQIVDVPNPVLVGTPRCWGPSPTASRPRFGSYGYSYSYDYAASSAAPSVSDVAISTNGSGPVEQPVTSAKG